MAHFGVEEGETKPFLSTELPSSYHPLVFNLLASEELTPTKSLRICGFELSNKMSWRKRSRRKTLRDKYPASRQRYHLCLFFSNLLWIRMQVMQLGSWSVKERNNHRFGKSFIAWNSPASNGIWQNLNIMIICNWKWIQTSDHCRTAFRMTMCDLSAEFWKVRVSFPYTNGIAEVTITKDD